MRRATTATVCRVSRRALSAAACAGIALALAAVLAATLPGCSSSIAPGGEETRIHAAPYHGHTLQNLYLGRSYMAQGRYELARERLLLALSSARDPQMRQLVTAEIEAVDRMIRSQR
jgi:Tfp pilus assembly protein PilF